MTELCRLATKYGTDKTIYTPFYSLLLERRRGMVRKVLEIGIGTQSAMKHVDSYQPGASLRMWEEYFPQAYIYGMDKDESVLFETARIYTFRAYQERPETYIDLLKHQGPFDLIVDDGSHNAEHQVVTAKALLPVIRKGGLYIIEDVNEADGLKFKLPFEHIDVYVRHGQEAHCMVINA